MNIAEEFESLLVNFGYYAKLAHQIDSPNQEDDLVIKIAIVGFSCNSPTDEWAQGHFLFLKERLDGDYSLENLAWYGPSSQKIQMFAALCFGCLLGLYQADKTTDEETRVAEKLIAGLIALKGGTLTSVSI